MKPFLCIYFIASLVLFSCKQETIPPTKNDVLTGSWEWRSSTGGVAGHTITPATTGKTMRVTFLNNQTVIWYENLQEIQRTTYKLTRRKMPSSEDEETVIEYANGSQETYTLTGPNNTVLTLVDTRVMDGYTKVYDKIVNP